MITGPQGSGKTTQAKIIAERLGLCLVKTGDLVRAKALEDSKEGQSLKLSLEKGDLSDDVIVAKLLKEELNQPMCQNGVVVDGYPRRISQLELFDPGFDLVFYLKVSDLIAVERMLKRGREDDTLEIIGERLKNFHHFTQQILNYYQDKQILTEIDGEQEIESVTGDIAKAIK
jgi:adenylate kinase